MYYDDTFLIVKIVVSKERKSFDLKLELWTPEREAKMNFDTKPYQAALTGYDTNLGHLFDDQIHL